MYRLLPYISKFLLLFSGFVTLYLTAKFFGPYNRGIIASATALVTLVATFGGLSVGRTIIFEIEKAKIAALAYYKENLLSILTLIACLMLLSIAVAGIWFYFFPINISSPILIGTFFILPYLMWSAYSSFIFSSLGKLEIQAILTIVNEIVFVSVLTVSLCLFKTGLFSFIVITAIFRLTSVGIEMYFLKRIINPLKRLSKQVIKGIVKSGLMLHLDSVGGYFIASVNVLVVNSFLNKESVGQFDLAMRLTTVLLVIPTISQIYISGDISKSGLKNAWSFIHKRARKTIGVLLLIVTIAILFSKVAIVKVFGSNYQVAADSFKYLMPYVLFNSMCMLFNPFALARGYFKTMSLLTIILGALNITLGYLLLPKYGLMGMIYCTNIVYTVAFAINIFFYLIIRKEAFNS